MQRLVPVGLDVLGTCVPTTGEECISATSEATAIGRQWLSEVSIVAREYDLLPIFCHISLNCTYLQAPSMQLPLVAVTRFLTSSDNQQLNATYFFLVSDGGLKWEACLHDKDLACTAATWLSEHCGLLRCSIAVSLQVRMLLLCHGRQCMPSFCMQGIFCQQTTRVQRVLVLSAAGCGFQWR